MTPRYTRALGLLSVFVMCVVTRPTNGSAPSVTHHAPPNGRDAARKTRALEAYGRLPLSFEANRGQTSAQVDFVSRGSGYTLFVTPTEAVLTLRAPSTRRPTTTNPKSSTRPGNLVPSEAQPTADAQSRVVRMQLVGANATARPEGRDELPGKVNHFIGNDPKRWSRGVPTYAQVRYQDVYAGIDLVYYGNQRELEYDFVVAPGANPDTIALTFEGADALEVDAAGNLVLHTGADRILQRAPRVYQDIDGVRKAVPSRYALQDATADRQQVRFDVGGYDRRHPLVIDPVIAYSTYLGGLSTDDAIGIAVDSAGSAYVTGDTASIGFPTTSDAFDTTLGGSGTYDAFVTKLDANGAGVVYSTFLGGSSHDTGLGIAVDSSGCAYVAGYTASANFPTTPGAFDRTYGGGTYDAFVTKLDPGGAALLYSTYLGGGQGVGQNAGFDIASGIAVDHAGNAFVTGLTYSSDFPITPGAFDTTFAGGDVFVTKLLASGSALAYSTYLGGSANDAGNGIALDSAGSAYVTGSTASSNFPTTPGAFDVTRGGGIFDAFVTKLEASGAALVYSTYLGGSQDESGEGIAIDGTGNVHVTGVTGSSDFPTTAGAVDVTFGGGYYDGFVTKLEASGAALVYSTYLGGSEREQPAGIAVDSAGNAYVTGYTASADFTTTPDAFDRTFGGITDAFVTKLDGSGTLLYSTYLGGTRHDQGNEISVDGVGNAYVAGGTESSSFPTTPGAFDRTRAGFDAFVVKIAAEPDVDFVETALSNPPAVVVLNEGFSVTDTVENQGSTPARTSRTHYYFSLDTSKTADDKRLTGDRSVPALGAGGTSTGLAGLTVPASTRLGAYYLLACADGTKVVSESDEADNCLDSTTTVEVRAPDLVVTAVSNPPAMRSPGGSLSATDTVANTGNAAAGTSTTRYYLSLNTKKHSIDPRLIGTRNVLALGVGGQSTGAVTVTIPATITPGSYYVLACGDDLKAVAEGNEGNNCKASATRVSIGG